MVLSSDQVVHFVHKQTANWGVIPSQQENKTQPIFRKKQKLLEELSRSDSVWGGIGQVMLPDPLSFFCVLLKILALAVSCIYNLLWVVLGESPFYYSIGYYTVECKNKLFISKAIQGFCCVKFLLELF